MLKGKGRCGGRGQAAASRSVSSSSILSMTLGSVLGVLCAEEERVFHPY